MRLWAPGTDLHAHTGQTAAILRPPAELSESRDNEDVERDERTSWVAREREQRHSFRLSSRSGYRSERGRLPGLHSDTSEVDCPAQVVFDDGL